MSGVNNLKKMLAQISAGNDELMALVRAAKLASAENAKKAEVKSLACDQDEAKPEAGGVAGARGPGNPEMTGARPEVDPEPGS
jgi:hypothetical protein